MDSKNPFILLESALPIEACNDIITSLNNIVPNYMNNNVIMTLKYNKLQEIRLQELVNDILDYAETHYEFQTRAISSFAFEWYPQSYKSEKLSVDGHTALQGDWIKSKEIDFVILIFLSTETDRINDPNIEHVGGGLQFPTHGFTIHPSAGDVLMFPTSKNFLYTISDIDLGNMNMVRIHISAMTDYKYDRRKFPGTYKTWFN